MALSGHWEGPLVGRSANGSFRTIADIGGPGDVAVVLALPASRLAERLRWPIAAVGLLAVAMTIASLMSLLSDGATATLAVLVAVPGVGLFLCEVFDPRFHNALSALNAERRQQARAIGFAARLFGWGLPVGDRLMFAVGLPLLFAGLVSGNLFHKFPAAALSFAGFWLVGAAQIALMVRGHPVDRFLGYF